jgi:hypothetical protein
MVAGVGASGASLTSTVYVSSPAAAGTSNTVAYTPGRERERERERQLRQGSVGEREREREAAQAGLSGREREREAAHIGLSGRESQARGEVEGGERGGSGRAQWERERERQLT